MPKPKLREIEMYITTIRVVWPEVRTKFLDMVPFLPGDQSNHLRNIVMIMEFFIPIVSYMFCLERERAKTEESERGLPVVVSESKIFRETQLQERERGKRRGAL